MIDHAQDLAAVFYGSDFACHFVRQREAADDLDVMAILGTQDDDALDGRAVAAARVGRFAGGQDVRAGDLLVAQVEAGFDVPAGTRLRVLDMPRRVNDGNEQEALLGSVA